MNGTIYGCLTLYNNGKASWPSMPFNDLEVTEANNHFFSYESTKPKMNDYIHGGYKVETFKSFVSSRGIAVTGFRIGEEESVGVLKSTIHNLLAINSVSSPEEQSNSSYLELAYSKVFSKLSTRDCLFLDIVSSQPKFVIMTREIPVYFVAALNDDVAYLFWTNEETLPERIRLEYKERFYLYRFPFLINGLCILQTNFLSKRYKHWTNVFKDKLKVMNALESHISRRTIKVLSMSVVNNTAPAGGTTDES